jgi:drug/metabolite transporter (DMT)-like permease
LNLEALGTIALGWLFFREHVGRRVAAAAALMFAGGTAVLADGFASGRSESVGLAAIVAATLAWAFDNAVLRPLADRDVRSVVVVKGTLGAALSCSLALLGHEAAPAPLRAAGLVVCGAVGYGLSLRFYLLAQRALGAGRTASVFATAPFVGAALAWTMGDRAGGLGLSVGAVLMAFAVYLHATERHGHRHHHHAMAHEHAHTHDDGHHDHHHDPMPAGAHSHWHEHSELEHSHEHAPDLHHEHEH